MTCVKGSILPGLLFSFVCFYGQIFRYTIILLKHFLNFLKFLLGYIVGVFVSALFIHPVKFNAQANQLIDEHYIDCVPYTGLMQMIH